MLNFVIHVGPHKTGSTYIQRRLDAGALELERIGIAVPTEWRDSEPNPSHTGLLRRLTSDRLNEVEHKFQSWKTGGYRFAVISCEALCAAPAEALRRLRDLIGDNPYTVVSYVRAWPELVSSAWSEGVVHGQLGPLPDFVVQNLRDPYSSPYINPAMVLGGLEKVFGKKSLRIVAYNSVISAGMDLFEHFMKEIVDTAAVPSGSQELVNLSLRPEKAELTRVLNYLHQQAGNGANADIAQALRHGPARDNALPMLERFSEFKRSFEIDASKKPIANVLSVSFAQYRGQAVKPVSTDRFYDPIPTKLEYISTDYLLRDGVVGELQDLRGKLLGATLPRRPLFERLLGRGGA